jgi:hypothetical protein
VDGGRGARRGRDEGAARTSTTLESVPGLGLRLRRCRNCCSYSWEHPAHSPSRRGAHDRLRAMKASTLGHRARERLAQPLPRAARALRAHPGKYLAMVQLASGLITFHVAQWF